MTRSLQTALGRLARRAAASLDPTTSAAVVIGFVVWVLARPFLHLAGALASLVDSATTLTVLLAAILIEASRETSTSVTRPDPRASGHPPVG